MTVEYLPVWSQTGPCAAVPDRNGWTFVYGEREVLMHVDGYMIIYAQRCCITLRASLTDGQKQAAIRELLRRLPQVIQPARRIILWDIDDAMSASMEEYNDKAIAT